MSTPTVSAFSSLDAHNGCRALFNGAKGWAYIGPAGSINAADYPGTVSYDYGGGKTSPRGGGEGSGENSPGQAQGQRPGQAQHARGGGGGGGGAAPSRPGEGLGRKTNDVRSAYLDAADLEHLLHEVERCAAADADAAGTEGDGGGGVEGGQCQPRRGRPIVLTLQAILSATISPPPMTTASASESGSNSAADSGSAACSGSRSASGTVPGTGAATEANLAVGGGVIEAEAVTGAGAAATKEGMGTGKSVGFSGASDLANFPPLALLGGYSAGKRGDLFLAPPITMVRGRSGGDGEGDGGGGTGGGLNRGVSCSEAVAAEAVQGGGGGGGAVGGLWRVGWWLRWGTNGADATGQGAERGGGGASTAAGAAPGAGSTAQSHQNGAGSEEREIASYETRTGVDGWQVVSSGAPLAAEQAVVGGEAGPQGSARVTPPATAATATATAPTTTTAVAAAKAVALAGGAWALVTGGWTGTAGNPVEGVTEAGGGGGDGEDDAASWCDCASDDVGQAVEEEAGMVSRDLPECPVAVSDGGRGGGDGGEVLGEAGGTTIEVALQCAVNSPVWNNNDSNSDTDTDTDNDSNKEISVVESTHQQQQQEGGSPPPAPPSPPRPSPERLGEACTNLAPAKKNTPISFRDMLMAPSATGAIGFSRSQAFRDRVAAAALAAGGVGGGGRMPPRSLACSAPTLVDGGTAGGAVFLWRKAAAGEGGKAADSKGDMEDEDPYYARKRVGAFAFKTKPRGKAHK